MSFTSDKSYAFVMSPRLGDTLLSMIVVNNLVRHGFRIKVFSTHLHALREWFPGFDIEPALDRASAVERLQHFDVVLHAYHADKVLPANAIHRQVVVMDDWPVYRQVKNMVDIQVELCQQHFALPDVVRENGMTVLSNLRARVETRRIIIHPSASDLQKSWLPMRFVKLALWLRTLGFEPEFLLQPETVEQWRWLERYGLRPQAHDNLSAVAAHIAESGWVIGNDSGIGHLASNLGVPTVSLAMRQRIARRWQPGWAPSRVVVAPPLMPGRFLKEKFWKYLVSTARVMSAFQQLRRDCGAPQLQSRVGPELKTKATDSVADVRHAG